MPIDRSEALLKEYTEVSNTFRALTDIRFRLLALLPIAAGAAAAVLANNRASASTLAFSLFGLVVTIGLVTYNTRNDQLYDTLVARAATIERILGLPDGAFANRPRPWLRLIGGAWKVGHRTAVAAIYGASLGLWLFGALDTGVEVVYNGLGKPTPDWLHLAAVVVAAGLILLGTWLMHRRRKHIGDTLRNLAKTAVTMATESTFQKLAANDRFRAVCAELGGIGEETVVTRLAFLSNLTPDGIGYYIAQGAGHWTAAQTVAVITDLAPEWLYDSATGRRRASRVAPSPS